MRRTLAEIRSRTLTLKWRIDIAGQFWRHPLNPKFCCHLHFSGLTDPLNHFPPPGDQLARTRISGLFQAVPACFAYYSGDKPMAWLSAFKCAPHRRRWFTLALAAAALPAMLFLFAGAAEAKDAHCPRGEHQSSGHCCPKGEDWTFFGCQKHAGRQAAEQDCMAGQERFGNGCQRISCPIGQELRGFSCQPISCGMGQTLVGNACMMDTTCPFGQTGTPPFCH
jgi:hypothetical protein